MADREDRVSSNGHGSANADGDRSANPYADALTGRKPREIAEFGLHTDPYANMLPRVSSMIRPGAGQAEEDEPRRRNPVLVVVSIALIVILVLSGLVGVIALLFH